MQKVLLYIEYVLIDELSPEVLQRVILYGGFDRETLDLCIFIGNHVMEIIML